MIWAKGPMMGVIQANPARAGRSPRQCSAPDPAAQAAKERPRAAMWLTRDWPGVRGPAGYMLTPALG